MSGPDEDRLLREQAEQRMLEAAIEEVIGVERAVPVRQADDVPEIRRSSAASPWLAAAALLLGSAVVVATLLLAAPSAAEEAGQGGELPPLVKAVGADELAQVDPATQHLEVHVASPADLEGLARLKALRAVVIRSVEEGSNDLLNDTAAWSEAGARALLGLTKCARLERVSVGYVSGMDARACDVLQRLPLLRDIELVGVQQLVDRRLVAGWSKLGLRRVRLVGVRLHPEGFAALCELPLLQELELDSTLHLWRCDLAALGRLRQLRRLVLRGVGGRFSHSLSKSHPLPGEEAARLPEEGPVMHTGMQMPGEARLVLTPAVMAAVAGLPALAELSLRGSVVDDAVMARLPSGLRKLHLGVTIGLTPASVRSLARLEELEDLAWSSVGVDQPPGVEEPDPELLGGAWIDLLSRLQLRRVSYHGGVDEALRDAFARQVGLQGFEWVAARGVAADLSFLESLSKLQELSLVNVEAFDAAPLARMPVLRRVETLRAAEPVKAALRDALRARDVELVLQ